MVDHGAALREMSGTATICPISMKLLAKAIAIASLFLPQLSRAASFDCKNAKSESEKLICSNKDLNRYDSDLGQVYNSALNRLPKDEATELRKSEHAWVKERDRDCVKDLKCYFKQIEDRTSFIHQLMIQPGSLPNINEWKVYTDPKFGFSFYYPKTWQILDGENGLKITHFGLTQDDHDPDVIDIKKVSTQKLNFVSTHNGDTILFYDEDTKQWMGELGKSGQDPHVGPARPISRTISGLPIFASTERYGGSIIALSHTKFLLLAERASGVTIEVESLAKGITEANKKIPKSEIQSVIRAELSERRY